MRKKKKPIGILVVDDENFFAEWLAENLRDNPHGYDAHWVNSARAALEFMDRQPVDLVISDIKMAGTSGIELLKVIRARHPGASVILMTGYALPELQQEAVKRGSLLYLEKPFPMERLESAIEQALKERVGEWESEEEKRNEGVKGWKGEGVKRNEGVKGWKGEGVKRNEGVKGWKGEGVKRNEGVKGWKGEGVNETITPTPPHPLTPSPLHPLTPSPPHPCTPSPLHLKTVASRQSLVASEKAVTSDQRPETSDQRLETSDQLTSDQQPATNAPPALSEEEQRGVLELLAASDHLEGGVLIATDTPGRATILASTLPESTVSPSTMADAHAFREMCHRLSVGLGRGKNSDKWPVTSDEQTTPHSSLVTRHCLLSFIQGDLGNVILCEIEVRGSWIVDRGSPVESRITNHESRISMFLLFVTNSRATLGLALLQARQRARKVAKIVDSGQ